MHPRWWKGLDFHIVDDVLDVKKFTDVVGKTASNDEATMKETYSRWLGLDGWRLQAEKLI